MLIIQLGTASYAQPDSLQQQQEKIIALNGATSTIITHKTIEENYGKTLVGLLNEQAGIVVNGAYQPRGSFTNLYMEGCMGGKVLILLNGIPIWDPSSISDTYFDLNFISLNEIEEVIIYRGAMSTQYGSGAMAGTINIITVKKEYNQPLNITAAIGLGNKASKEVATKLWGAKNKFNYTLSYSDYKTNGFSYAQDTTGKNNFDKDGFRNTVYDAHITFHVSKRLAISGYYLHSKYKADADEESFLDTKNYYYTNTIINKRLEIKYKKNNFSLVGNYNVCNAIRDYHYSNTNSEFIKGSAQFADININTSLFKNTYLSVGINYRSGTFLNNFHDSLYGTSQNKYPSTYQYGGYTAVNYQNRDSSYFVAIGVGTNNCKQTNTTGTFFINNSFRLIKSVRAFANLHTGMLTPSIYQSYDSNIGNRNLSNETMVNGQLGLEITINTSTHKVSFFQNNLRNGIDFNSNASIYANCYSLQSVGIEYEIQLLLSNQFKLEGNYTYLSGKEKAISRQNFSDTVSYNYLIRRPKHIINCTLTYKGQIETISISGKYVSSYYEAGLATNDYKMNSYWLINLNSSITLNKTMSVNLGIQNLANNTFHDTRGYNSIPLLFNLSGLITL